MVKPEDFWTVNESKKKEEKYREIILRAGREVVGLLKKAENAYKRGRDSPGSYLVGEALAYYLSAKTMAKALGLDFNRSPFKSAITIPNFEEALSAVIPKPGEGPVKTVVIKHERDPRGIKLEFEKEERRRIEASRASEPKTSSTEESPDDPVFKDLISALTGKTIGWTREKAFEKAREVWAPGEKLEDLLVKVLRSD